MPAPTAWPFAMAMGSALTFTGLLTDVSVSVLGGILTICGAVGWFRQVLPLEHHEALAVETRGACRRSSSARGHAAGSRGTGATRLAADQDLSHLGGVKGGLAGGVAMAILAVIYGLAMYHSVWYPINLLAGTLYSPSATPIDGSDDAFPHGLVSVRPGHAHHHVPACGTSVRRDAAAAAYAVLSC